MLKHRIIVRVEGGGVKSGKMEMCSKRSGMEKSGLTEGDRDLAM